MKVTKRETAIHCRIADSSSRNAVSFSSARTTNRFRSSRWASTTQIVRPLESIAETQPQLQPALLRLSAMISQYFTRHLSTLTKCRREQLNLTTSPTAGTRHGPAWARINRYDISDIPNSGIREGRRRRRDRFFSPERGRRCFPSAGRRRLAPDK